MNKILSFTAALIASFFLQPNNAQAMHFNFFKKTTTASGDSHSIYYQGNEIHKTQFIFIEKYFDLFVLPGNYKSEYILSDKTYTDLGLIFYQANPSIKAQFFKQIFKNPFADLAGSGFTEDQVLKIMGQKEDVLQQLFDIYDQPTLEKLLFEESAGETPITLAIKNDKYGLASVYIHMACTKNEDLLKQLLSFIKKTQIVKSDAELAILAETITAKLTTNRNNATADTGEQTTFNLNNDQHLDVSNTSSHESNKISPDQIKNANQKNSTQASNSKKHTLSSDIVTTFSELKIDQSSIPSKINTSIPNKHQLNKNAKHISFSTEIDQKLNSNNNRAKTETINSTRKKNNQQNAIKSQNGVTKGNQSTPQSSTLKANGNIKNEFDDFFGGLTAAEHSALQAIMLKEEERKRNAAAAEKITFKAKKTETEIELKIIHETNTEPLKAKKQSRVDSFLEVLKTSTTDKKAFIKASKDLKKEIQKKPLSLHEIQSIVDHFINKKDVLNFITFFDDMPMTYEIFWKCKGLFNFICNNAQDEKVKNLFDAWNIDLSLDEKIKSVDHDRAINVGLLQQITVPAVQEKNTYSEEELTFKTLFADFLAKNNSSLNKKNEAKLIVKISNFNKNNKSDVNFFTSNDAKLKMLSSDLLLPLVDQKKAIITLSINENYYIALLYAVIAGNLDSVDWFLGNIKKLDSDLDISLGGQSILQYAIYLLVMLPNHPLSLKIKIIEKICKHTQIKTIINKAHSDGDTALHFVVKNFSSPEIAEILIQHGANVNLPNKNGSTPLHYAAFNFQSPAMAKLLVQYGADIYCPNGTGLMACQLAISNVFRFTESLNNQISVDELKRCYELIHNLTDSTILKPYTTTFIMSTPYKNDRQEDACADYLMEYPDVIGSWIEKYGKNMMIPFIASTVSTSVLKKLIEKDPEFVTKYLSKSVKLRGRTETCLSLAESCSKKKYSMNHAAKFNAFKRVVDNFTKKTATSNTNFIADLTEDFDLINIDFSNMGTHCKKNLLLQAIEKGDINFIQQNDVMFKKLLDCGTDKDKELPSDHDYVQSLFWAIREKQFECVCYFLDKIQWASRINNLQSPMQLLTHSILKHVLIKQDLDFAYRVMNEVFTKYPNKFSINTVNQAGETLLHFACQRFLGKKLINLILEQPGINVCIKDKNKCYAYDYLTVQFNDDNNDELGQSLDKIIEMSIDTAREVK